MKQHLKTLVVLAALCVGTPAFAVTVDDVVGLTRAGASDAIILSKIDADGTVFHLTVDEILHLKQAGVSDPVITYMINSGKSEDADSAAPYVEDDIVRGDVTVYDDAEDDDSDDDDSGDVRGSVFVSYGSYYPHWPGYGWSYYYDPFWWPSVAFYFSYWTPYPYYARYRDPFYHCHPYAHDYWYSYGSWDLGGRDSWDHGRRDHARGIADGRHVGSRGGDRAERTIKPRARVDQERYISNQPVTSRRAVQAPGRVIKSPDRVIKAPGRVIKSPGRVIRAPDASVRPSRVAGRGNVRRAVRPPEVRRVTPAPEAVATPPAPPVPEARPARDVRVQKAVRPSEVRRSDSPREKSPRMAKPSRTVDRSASRKKK